jgi:hypothetical protein
MPRPMFPQPRLSEFDDDNRDVAGSIPHAQFTRCRHSRHLTTLRTTNLTEIGFYDVPGAHAHVR